jgi:hypothetical protein
MEIIEWKPNERTLIQTWHKKLVQQKIKDTGLVPPVTILAAST